MSYHVIFAIALLVRLAAGAPRHHPALYADETVQNYLTTFGYLPQADREFQSLRTEDQLIEAIKDLQSYGGIPVTGVIDEETKRLMKAPRCALADKPDPRFSVRSRSYGGWNRRQKRYSIHGHQWKHHNLTWSLRTERPGGLNTGAVRAALSRALDLWARNSKLTFQEINSDDADILVYFKKRYHGDGYPFDGKGQILAHAFFPGQDRGGDAHFDEEESWLLEDEPSEEGTSLFAVAAHEFGHSLGLAHSSERGALMYPWYQGITVNYELPDDDKHGIQQMYGSPEEKLWGSIDSRPIPPQRPTRPPTTTTTTTTTTTYRPWRTRPNHHPEEPRRPNYYPHKPDYRTERPRRPETGRPRYQPTTPSTALDVPDTCDTSYDAISIIRRETFIFKGQYFWRIGKSGLLTGYPAKITQFFELPADLDHVDAVYERTDKKIVFFIGKLYYVFDANRLEAGYPKPLTHLGLPASLEKIDGAMIWGHNARTYFFSGTMYWRYDEEEKHTEWDYPRDMAMFAMGVGYNIDAVFQWKDGKTYFFKGKGFWEFDDLRMKVANEEQRPSAPFWMGCPNVTPDVRDEDSNLPKRARIFSGSERSSVLTLPTLFVVAVVVLRLS